MKKQTYEIWHKITYSKMYKVKAEDLDEAREAVEELATNQSDYKDYELEEEFTE